jgi:hypothetical protein
LVLRVILIVGVIFLAASTSIVTDTPHYIVLGEYKLSDELKETSGLYCPESGSAFTVNDSGNKPIIYNIDNTGRIIGKKVVSTKNIDWEALTGDGQYFYIGDVGNNNGKRKFVQIHAVPKQDNKSENIVTTYKLSYINNSVKNNKYLNHDFDAETLINWHDSLLLFSKSWNTGTLLIYQLNKNQPEQFVEHITEIKELPGIITGGDFDSKRNRFILVGYKLSRMGDFSPFIVILNKDLTFYKFFELQGYGQVEGVCVTPDDEVWFTQESSFFSYHKLVKLKVVK